MSGAYMDGRINNGCKKGENRGQGRKRKAISLQMIERMDATLAPIELWEALAEQVKKGDTQAIKCWLAYRYGTPTQAIDIQGANSGLTIIKRVLVGSGANDASGSINQ